MKAIAVYEALPTDNPNCFESIDLEMPVPDGLDILVRIDGIAINPVDSKERLGLSGRLDEPLVLGWDACGEAATLPLTTLVARQLSNCTIIATASRPQSQKWCADLGAHHVIDHSADLEKQLQAIGFETVPYILNCSNNIPYWEIMSRLVAPEGAICLVASTKAKLDLDLYMAKSVRINCELMFTRSIFGTDKMPVQGEVLSRVSEMISAGTIRHVMTRNLGAMDTSTLADAHKIIEQGRMIGKIALSGIQKQGGV